MFKSPISISSRAEFGTEKAELANLYHCMQERTTFMSTLDAILFIIGIILLVCGIGIAAYLAYDWAVWRIDERRRQRRDAGVGDDGWIRPPRLNGNRRFRA